MNLTLTFLGCPSFRRKVPPVTRFLVGSTLLVTVGPLLKLVNPYFFLLWWPAIIKHGQVWRLVTNFFLTGGGIQVIFDLFLLGRNSLDLEVNAYYRRTADYTWSLLIVNALIVATNYPLQSTVLFNPMLMALNYLWARNNPSASVSLFGLVTCPAPLLPYAYLLFDLLRGGMGLAVQSATGILSAHIYYYLSTVLPATNGGRGPNLLPAAPAMLRRLLPDSVDPAFANAPRSDGRDSGTASASGGGRVLSTQWGGTAFAPRGREFGDGQTNWGGGNSASGQTIGSSGSGSGSSSSSSSGSGGGGAGWLSFLNRSRGGQTGSSSTLSTAPKTNAAAQRQAMLEATERRLRAQRENSIAGRNEAAAARNAHAQTTAASSPVEGRAGTSSFGSTATPRPPTNAAAPRTTEGPPSASASTLRSRFASSARSNSEDQDEQHLDASGSGGSVAEERRPDKDHKSGASQQSQQTTQQDGDGEYRWGPGQRLGE